jgi:hypothetical protein
MHNETPSAKPVMRSLWQTWYVLGDILGFALQRSLAFSERVLLDLRLNGDR